MKQIDYDYGASDSMLRALDNTPIGFVSYEVLSDAGRAFGVPDYDKVLSFLVEEGLLKESTRGYQITARGRVFVHKGGFEGQRRSERFERLCLIIATLCSIIAAIASILAIVLLECR